MNPPVQGMVAQAAITPPLPAEQAAPPVDGHFVPCPLYSGKKQGLAECATFAVPLDWSHGDDGVHIDLFVKRIAAHAKARGSIWLLAGGPGGAGDDLEWLAETLAFLQPDLDVYLPDHRGTGRSARLSCPTQEAVTSAGGSTVTSGEWPACIAALQTMWGPGLQHFQTTAAARDLQATIAATRKPGQELYVYGVSYGTYWAMRWLTLFPQEPNGVALDGVCPPQGCKIAGYDAQFERVGQQVLDRCGQDPQCRSQFGPDPWQRATGVFTALDQGWCQPLRDQGLDRKRLRNLLGVLLTDWELRTYIPAVLKRVERCSALDVEAVGQLLQVFTPDDAVSLAPAPLQSLPLGVHVLLSEMYGRERTIDPSAMVSLDQSARMAALHDLWPRYQPDAAVGRWPKTQAPVLMLNGTLDPQTPVEQAELAAQHLHGKLQRLIELPGAAHGTLTASPVDDSEQACGLQLLLGFLKAPGAEPDLHCLGHLLPVDFAGDPLLSVALLGTTSTWGATQVDGVAARAARARGVPALERVKRAR